MTADIREHLYAFYIRKKMQKLHWEEHIPDSRARHLYNEMRTRIDSFDYIRTGVNKFMYNEELI